MMETNKPRLTEDQAYEAVMNLIAEGNGGILFLDVPGGTGKTFLINCILAEIRSKRHIALAVASSGRNSSFHTFGWWSNRSFSITVTTKLSSN
ncbi:hypothetical protein AVEN_206002-1 [Araneus ventricosus]|uniref:ATP-dependent DNA helicase n=1 Tax=Araneus ventricosus TaxID=182803 RepID=A0A4Y2GYF5_ARAVE|nr:hypothetical protein AVEN_206002-1 [Araneus ventricosus]